MKDHLNQINEALQRHGHCFLPGIGLLYIVHKPAQQDFQENKLYSPLQQIALDTQQKNGEKFFSIEQQLMLSNGLSEEEAKKRWEELRDQIREKLSTGSSVALEKLGYLNLDEERRIQFVQDNDPLIFYEPVSIAPLKKPVLETKAGSPDIEEKASQEIAQQAEVVSPPLPVSEKSNAGGKLKIGPSWWIAVSIVALLIVGWFIYKGTIQRKGEKLALKQKLDSSAVTAVTPTIDSLKQVSDSIDKANDSISYLIVIAVYKNKDKAEHQYKRMKGWGHPVVLKRKDSNTYEMALSFSSLPFDTATNLERMKRTYGSKAFIEYNASVN